MAREVFVDTSGFYALLVKDDDQHLAAAKVLRDAEKGRGRFVTTDYVLDETVTLLIARKHPSLVGLLLSATLHSRACRVEWTDPERFSQTADFALKRLDQRWSFTDCLSFVVMKQLRLRDALTKDRHFAQAGFETLLRE
jgi:predicted nucleic acid-binding protein